MLTVNVMNSCSEQPCKTDADVIHALETAHISPIDYPLVHQWRNTILSYPEHVRNGLVLCPSVWHVHLTLNLIQPCCNWLCHFRPKGQGDYA